MGVRPKDPHLFTLGAQLDQLARENRAVAAAAASFEETRDRIVSGRVQAAHPLPCSDPECIWHAGEG